MPEFALRTAELLDGKAVTALLEASYGQLLPLAYGEALARALLPVIAKARSELLASGRYHLAVTSKGDVIGAGGWSEERPGTGEIDVGTAHIRHVATHPDWVGRGVGRAIIECVIAEAKQGGIRRVECFASLNAVDFYSRLGFLEVRPIDIHLGGDLVMPSLLMERML